ncbi:MAG: hypothetical protein QME74_00945 [Candidatus Edwardsbacteria bacterium]|nr:hypothetical protein [Candidatus Edwardsbacteria bacterium]
MKSKHILAILGLIALALAGCSALTPAPELIITKVDPASTTADSAAITITFQNVNKVDAILTTSRFTYRGLSGTTQSPVFNHSLYVPGNVGSVNLNVTVTGLTNIRTNLGSPVTMWIRFWGTDAYGYNKTFATDSVAINCN